MRNGDTHLLRTEDTHLSLRYRGRDEDTHPSLRYGGMKKGTRTLRYATGACLRLSRPPQPAITGGATDAGVKGGLRRCHWVAFS
jgi:hypothetical protein